jgi:NAD(P)-dependent dehydrogenase (short-subunit alcohol dehydrogenase family)
MTGVQAQRSPLALFDLEGRSALVTGATGAFGRAAAEALAAAGARVTLAAGDRERLETLAHDLGGGDGNVALVARRAATEQDAEAIVAEALRAHGRLDLVVTAAGTNVVHPIGEFPVAEWQSVMNANLLCSWLVARAASHPLLGQGTGGAVVFVSSTRGRLGHPAGYSAYVPSKHAIEGLTRTLACEWGPHGIRVNAIGPTVFRSELTAWMYADDERATATREGMLARIPLGRLGEPSDFVGALVFLCSDASAFVTGQVLYVDGGYTAG